MAPARTKLCLHRVASKMLITISLWAKQFDPMPTSEDILKLAKTIVGELDHYGRGAPPFIE